MDHGSPLSRSSPSNSSASDAAEIDVDAPFDKLGADFLGMLEFLFELEDHFSISISAGRGGEREDHSLARFAGGSAAGDGADSSPGLARVPRVLVTGIGVIAPCGRAADELFRSRRTRSAVSPVLKGAQNASSSLVVAEVCFDASAHWPANESAQFDRVTQFAVVASSKPSLTPGCRSAKPSYSTRASIGARASAARRRSKIHIRQLRVRRQARPSDGRRAWHEQRRGGARSMAHGFRGPMLNFRPRARRRPRASARRSSHPKRGRACDAGRRLGSADHAGQPRGVGRDARARARVPRRSRTELQAVGVFGGLEDQCRRSLAEHEPVVGRERLAASRGIGGVGMRERAHRVPRREVPRRDERFRTAGQHHMGVAVSDEPIRFADARGRRRARRRKVEHRPAEAMRHRNVRRRGVVHAKHNGRWAHAPAR